TGRTLAACTRSSATTGPSPRISASGSEPATGPGLTEDSEADPADRRPSEPFVRFPRLRLRDPAIDLVELPWELPLAEWPSDVLDFRHVPVGPSRHLVRFLVSNGVLYALKELPPGPARRQARAPPHPAS